MRGMKTLTIGNVAGKAGVNIETLRYYERRGLLPKPPRTGSGYRMYPGDAVTRVRFIKRAQELGFSLREINELLALRVRPRAGCADVLQRAEAKVADIEEKIGDLKRMKKALAKLMDACPGKGPLSDCPILDALDRNGGERP